MINLFCLNQQQSQLKFVRDLSVIPKLYYSALLTDSVGGPVMGPKVIFKVGTHRAKLICDFQPGI